MSINPETQEWFNYLLLALLLTAAAIRLRRPVRSILTLISDTRHRRVLRSANQRSASERLGQLEAAAIEQLQMRVSQFDLDAFRSRGLEIARRVHQAWSNGEMGDCRRFLSQGLYNRLRIQLTILKQMENSQHIIADFQPRQFLMVEGRQSGEYDCLVARVDGEMRDTWVTPGDAAKDVQKRLAAAPRRPFSHYYSFMRRHGAQNTLTRSLADCSRCGTPYVGESEINKCRSCGAIAGSGRFDWVLTEMTQEEHKAGSASHRFLLANNDARKSSFWQYRGPINLNKAYGADADRIEDRAACLFWRDILYRMSGDEQYVRRDATDAYLKQPINNERLCNITVATVEVEQVKNEAGTAVARVLVKWSAANSNGAQTRRRRSTMLLHAAPDFISETGFADLGCPACGAPLPETDSTHCSYCRSPLQGKNRDWLLDGVVTEAV